MTPGRSGAGREAGELMARHEEERLSLWPLDPTEAIKLILQVDPYEVVTVIPKTRRRVKCNQCRKSFPSCDTIGQLSGTPSGPWYFCRPCWTDVLGLELPEEAQPATAEPPRAAGDAAGRGE